MDENFGNSTKLNKLNRIKLCTELNSIFKQTNFFVENFTPMFFNLWCVWVSLERLKVEFDASNHSIKKETTKSMSIKRRVIVYLPKTTIFLTNTATGIVLCKN